MVRAELSGSLFPGNHDDLLFMPLLKLFPQPGSPHSSAISLSMSFHTPLGLWCLLPTPGPIQLLFLYAVGTMHLSGVLPLCLLTSCLTQDSLFL